MVSDLLVDLTMDKLNHIADAVLLNNNSNYLI